MVTCTVKPPIPVTGSVAVVGVVFELGAGGSAEKSINPSGRKPELQETSCAFCAYVMLVTKVSRNKARKCFKIPPQCCCACREGHRLQHAGRQSEIQRSQRGW